MLVTVRIVSGLILVEMLDDRRGEPHFFLALAEYCDMVRIEGRFTSNKYNSLKGQRAQDLVFWGRKNKQKTHTL